MLRIAFMVLWLRAPGETATGARANTFDLALLSCRSSAFNDADLPGAEGPRAGGQAGGQAGGRAATIPCNKVKKLKTFTD